MKIVVGITGASGTHLGIKLYEALPKNIDKYLIISEHAKVAASKESFLNKDIAAPVASGSFGADALAVVPCSMNTLAKIAAGIADNLITRTATVMLKEQKRLLLAPRELPFSPIDLENMAKLARYNVIIAPPVVGYYSQPKSVEEIEEFFIGKWLDLLGIYNNLYKRWGV